MFQKAKESDFRLVRDFYWDLIDEMRSENDKIGWKKGIYPTDLFLKQSLSGGELYLLTDGGDLCACVILNSTANDGYEGVPWSIECENKDILIPHALAVSPRMQGQGIGARLVKEIINVAKAENKKAIRLDILGTNTAAKRLYTKCGFSFVQAKPLFYEDTGWTEYKMYELNL